MKITEMLITGYDGRRPVFVVNVLPETASAVLLTHEDGEDVVEVAAERNTRMFIPMKKLLEGAIVVAP